MQSRDKTPWLRRQRAVLLSCATLAAAAPALAAASSETQQLKALQQQLAQVQSALAQLTRENQVLREHERDIDQKLAQLAAAQGPAAGSAALAAQAAAPGATGALSAASAAPPRDTSALPTGSTAPVGSSLGSPSPNLRLWGYGEIYYLNPDQRPLADHPGPGARGVRHRLQVR